MSGLDDRRQFLFGGILLAASGVAVLARPPARRDLASADDLAQSIPERIGAYRFQAADDVVLPERDETSLRIYQQYVARTYHAAGRTPVTLLIAYGASQDYQLQVHRPESCYPMAGFSIGRSTRVPLRLDANRSIEAVALTATRLGRTDQLLYWVRVADQFPPTLWTQRAAMLELALQRRAADGVLVRLSTPGSGPAAVAILAAFTTSLLADVGAYARRLILGQGATA